MYVACKCDAIIQKCSEGDCLIGTGWFHTGTASHYCAYTGDVAQPNGFRDKPKEPSSRVPAPNKVPYIPSTRLSELATELRELAAENRMVFRQNSGIGLYISSDYYSARASAFTEAAEMVESSKKE